MAVAKILIVYIMSMLNKVFIRFYNHHNFTNFSLKMKSENTELPDTTTSVTAGIGASFKANNKTVKT